jgi:hypothetical protein
MEYYPSLDAIFNFFAFFSIIPVIYRHKCKARALDAKSICMVHERGGEGEGGGRGVYDQKPVRSNPSDKSRSSSNIIIKFSSLSFFSIANFVSHLAYNVEHQVVPAVIPIYNTKFTDK